MAMIASFARGIGSAGRYCLALAALSAASFAQGQPARLLPFASLSDGAVGCSLQWLVQRSAVILSGEVLGAEASSASVSSNLIRVDRAFRGVSAGDSFRFTQRSGGNELPLYPHERVILFLHAPNAAGFASSASGSFGMLTIGGGSLVDVRGLRLLGAQRCAATGEPPLADVALPGGLRHPIISGPPLLTVASRASTSLPSTQVFSMISALVREQAAHVR